MTMVASHLELAAMVPGCTATCMVASVVPLVLKVPPGNNQAPPHESVVAAAVKFRVAPVLLVMRRPCAGGFAGRFERRMSGGSLIRAVEQP